MKRKNITKILLFFILIISILQKSIFANTLILKVATDKDEYKINDNIKVTINWDNKMQAASYKIKYDSSKLKFKSADIAESFYNSSKEGEITVNWASMNEEDFTKMTFEFTAIEKGNANIKISNVEAFADGNLVSPTNYDYNTYGDKTVIVKELKNSEASEDKEEDGNKPSDNENVDEGEKLPQTDKDKQENNNGNGIENNDNTTAEGKLPQTGLEKITILLISLLVIIGLVGFIKYKKLSDI